VGGCALVLKLRNEIDVSVHAAAMVAMAKSACGQDRNSFVTIYRIEHMRRPLRRQSRKVRAGAPSCPSVAAVYLSAP